MRVWAIANQKGGVGKTTTTITLAGLLSMRGKRTLVIDMDPHGSMTSYFGYSPDEVNSGVYRLFVDDLYAPESLPRETKFARISLLPASMALATLDRQLGTQHGKGLVLKKMLNALRHQFDYVLIDCPPILGVLMVNALAACDYLVIPVQSEFLALKGLERMIRTLQMMERSRPVPLPYIIVPTMYDRRTKASAQALEQLVETYPEDLWRSVVPVDTQFREASQVGIPLPLMRPSSRGVLAYNSLLDALPGAVERLPSLESEKR